MLVTAKIFVFDGEREFSKKVEDATMNHKSGKLGLIWKTRITITIIFGLSRKKSGLQPLQMQPVGIDTFQREDSSCQVLRT